MGLSYLLTDEAYAVTITHYNREGCEGNQHWFFLGAGLGLWSCWQISTAVGVFLGAVIPSSWSLDFALPLTFIALVVPALKDRAGVAAALVGGVVALLVFCSALSTRDHRRGAGRHHCRNAGGGQAMNIWAVMFFGGLLTYLIRLSFIWVFARLAVPRLLRQSLRFVPPAVLSVIVFQELLLRDGRLVIGLDNTRLLAGLLAILVAWRTRNPLLTILSGMAALLILNAVLPGWK